MSHDLKLICPIIATYIINYYSIPLRLFIVGGGEIISNEGTRWRNSYGSTFIRYSTSTINQIPAWNYQIKKMNAKEVVFADNFSLTGILNCINDYWDKLTATGPKYRYFPKPTKSYVIVK